MKSDRIIQERIFNQKNNFEYEIMGYKKTLNWRCWTEKGTEEEPGEKLKERGLYEKTCNSSMS